MRPLGAGRLLLAAGLIFLVLLGGTEAGRLATVLRAASALIGGVAIVCYLRQMPRENDHTDRLVLAGLLLFLMTCVTSAWLRSSFDAATSAVAYVAAFYLARGAVADERGRQMAITVLGTIGIVVGLTFLIIWGSIWLPWATIPGAGFPPFDISLPSYLYGHQYPVGMLAAMLFERAFGGDRMGEITTLLRLRDPGLAATITHAAGGISPVWSSFYDNRYYDRLAIPPPNDFALPTSASGLSAWLRDPVRAADRGAPGSGWSACR